MTAAGTAEETWAAGTVSAGADAATSFAGGCRNARYAPAPAAPATSAPASSIATDLFMIVSLS